MGKFYSVGQIVQGDFANKYVAKWTETKWGIAPAKEFTTSALFGGLRWAGGNWTGPSADESISSDTVDHYVELGQQQTGPDAGAMLKGSLIGGIGLGLLAGAASASSTADVAIYLKNGKKFVVHFYTARAWQDLKSKLFIL